MDLAMAVLIDVGHAEQMLELSSLNDRLLSCSQFQDQSGIVNGVDVSEYLNETVVAADAAGICIGRGDSLSGHLLARLPRNVGKL